MAQRLLILGGTAEAAALARGAFARFGNDVQVTTSLAGRTEQPSPLPGQTRIGGFGGPLGLSAYLEEHRVDRLIDATHPFAARISAAARMACELAKVPRLALLRPPWRPDPLDKWIEVDNMQAAAAIVGRVARRAWLTVGSTEISAFSGVAGVHFLVRLVDRPRQRLPLACYDLIVERGPFTLIEERRHIERHAIQALVCKASGGAATEAKIVAARELGLPVIIIRRPPAEPGHTVDNVEAALDWLADIPTPTEAKGISCGLA